MDWLAESELEGWGGKDGKRNGERETVCDANERVKVAGERDVWPCCGVKAGDGIDVNAVLDIVAVFAGTAGQHETDEVVHPTACDVVVGPLDDLGEG